MQTAWNGLGFPAMNMVLSEVFEPQSLLVVLSDIPGIVTKVNLPTTTHGVHLWAQQGGSTWYALDHDPGPIQSPNGDTLITMGAFRPGGVLMPDQWQLLALPDDSLAHTLHLVSSAPSVLLWLLALTEIVG